MTATLRSPQMQTISFGMEPHMTAVGAGSLATVLFHAGGFTDGWTCPADRRVRMDKLTVSADIAALPFTLSPFAYTVFSVGVYKDNALSPSNGVFNTTWISAASPWNDVLGTDDTVNNAGMEWLSPGEDMVVVASLTGIAGAGRSHVYDICGSVDLEYYKP